VNELPSVFCLPTYRHYPIHPVHETPRGEGGIVS